MQKRVKGLRIQRKAKQYLEDRGYLVYMIHHTRWSKDIFGLFDGFAIRETSTKAIHFEHTPKRKTIIKKPPNIIYFQVKSNAFPKKEPYDEFSKKYGVKCWLMKWIDRRGWEIYETYCGRQRIWSDGIR